ncbi:MAG: glycosyltransferase family 2 protein, partial [Candidatus Omnitrophica bacterium]|nr:glycosyltransferase family 2 protein [Candidatus Omnitrophota bacterium]
MPRVSVVVCTYNRCESLRDNLQSLRDQQLIEGLELEMVVVDNNSKDATPKVVEEVGRTSAWPVRYLFEPIQGKSHALNRGIKAARGDFIAFCDDDVIADQLWIQSLCEAFLAYDADAVGGPVRPLWFGKPPKWLEDPERQFGMLAILDRGDKPIIAGEAEQAAGNFLLGSNL